MLPPQGVWLIEVTLRVENRSQILTCLEPGMEDIIYIYMNIYIYIYIYDYIYIYI